VITADRITHILLARHASEFVMAELYGKIPAAEGKADRCNFSKELIFSGGHGSWVDNCTRRGISLRINTMEIKVVTALLHGRWCGFVRAHCMRL